MPICFGIPLSGLSDSWSTRGGSTFKWAAIFNFSRFGSFACAKNPSLLLSVLSTSVHLLFSRWTSSAFQCTISIFSGKSHFKNKNVPERPFYVNNWNFKIRRFFLDIHEILWRWQNYFELVFKNTSKRANSSRFANYLFLQQRDIFNVKELC